MTTTASPPTTSRVLSAPAAPSPRQDGFDIATPAPVDRLGAIWRGKWWIILSAILAAGLTLTVTMLIPKTFSASVQVELNASPVTGSSAADLAVASNNLASQYAQVVTSEAVLQPAAAAAGTSSTELGSLTSATTLASQNIILVTVQGSEPAKAQAGATALGQSLVDYVSTQGAETSKRYSDLVMSQLKPLDGQISRARASVASANKTLSKADKRTAPQTISAASARINAAQSLLTVLTDRRANLVIQSSLQAISLAPRVQQLGGVSAATQVEPRPTLYAPIAGLLGLVIASQVVVMASERRRARRIAQGQV